MSCRGTVKATPGSVGSNRFPRRFLLDRPRLGLVYAWTLFMSRQLDRADQFLDQLLPLVQTAPHLLGEVFAIRVMVAASRYNMPAVIELAQQALSLVPPEEASRAAGFCLV